MRSSKELAMYAKGFGLTALLALTACQGNANRDARIDALETRQALTTPTPDMTLQAMNETISVLETRVATSSSTLIGAQDSAASILTNPTPIAGLLEATPAPSSNSIGVQEQTASDIKPIMRVSPKNPEFQTFAEGRTRTFDGGAIILEGFADTVTPIRMAGENEFANTTCTLQDKAACNVLGDPGVLSYDHQIDPKDLSGMIACAEEQPDNFANCISDLNIQLPQNNPSAVWSGGANVDNLHENEFGSQLLPEAGYLKVTAPEVQIVGGGFKISLRAQENTNYTVLFRGLYEGEGDRNIRLGFYSEHTGTVKVMRYPVKAEAGAFFSEQHLREDVIAGHETDNCGEGGCERSIIAIVDPNDGSYTLFENLSGSTEWKLIGTNVN